MSIRPSAIDRHARYAVWTFLALATFALGSLATARADETPKKTGRILMVTQMPASSTARSAARGTSYRRPSRP